MRQAGQQTRPDGCSQNWPERIFPLGRCPSHVTNYRCTLIGELDETREPICSRCFPPSARCGDDPGIAIVAIMAPVLKENDWRWIFFVELKTDLCAVVVHYYKADMEGGEVRYRSHVLDVYFVNIFFNHSTKYCSWQLCHSVGTNGFIANIASLFVNSALPNIYVPYGH